MNKASKIYLVLLVWVAAMLQLYVNSKLNQEKYVVAEAMAVGEDKLSMGCVTAYGYYSDDELTADKRQTIVINLAKQLGIDTDYQIEDRETTDGIVTALKKEGAQADTQVKVISLNNGENYIYTELLLKGMAATNAYKYKVKLAQMYADVGVAARTEYYIEERQKGQMDGAERASITEDFLRGMGARAVAEYEIEGAYMIYGYSDDIDEYVYQDDEKVNVNIAFSYDETEDVTRIYRGIPFVDRSF